MYITKRDGSLEAFSLEKIINAIEKAYKSTYGDVYDSDICIIINYLDKNYSGELTSVENIQDCVEKSLMECGFSNVAKNYILYRKKRENIRLSKTKVNQIFDEILKSNGSDISRENANVDGNAPMGLMLQFGSELEKDYVTRNLISEKFVDLHNEGFFHIHDLNFYACTFNCCHIDLETLFKNGFNTGDGFIRKPNSISSAASLAAIVIQSNQNDMFGGQGIPMFEYNLAPYVAKTFAKRLRECIEILLGIDNLVEIEDICKNIYNKNGSLLDNFDKVKWFVNYHYNTEDKTSKIVDKALSLTDRDTYQAMEGFIANMNSLHSRCLPEDEEVITPTCTCSIKYVKTTDYVLSYNTELKKYEYKKVLRVLDNGEKELIKITLENGHILRCTKDHKLYTSKGYVEADKAVDIMTKNGYVNIISKENDIRENVYDIEVEDNHNFCVKNKNKDDFIVVHNCGAQVPFSSINYGTGTTAEQRMIILNVLKATDAGLGHHETPLFPIQIFKVKEGVNALKGDPNYDLYQYACSITAKRFYPNYVNIDVPFNLQYYRKGKPETEMATMGALSSSSSVVLYNITVPSSDINFRTKLFFNEVEDYLVKNKLVGEPIQFDENTVYYSTDGVRIQDSDTGRLVKIKKFMIFKTNPTQHWYRVHCVLHNNGHKMRWSFDATDDHPLPVVGKGRTFVSDLIPGDFISASECSGWESVEVIEKEKLNIQKTGYDFETESDKFDTDYIVSHNCRTRVIGQLNTSEGSVRNRGNIAFTTINLPRIALETRDIEKFFDMFDDLITSSIDELLERVEFISKKKVYNFPFLMGQNLYMGSENLGSDDEIREALKNGTLSVGFCGLAECLKVLTGKHHGESEESYNLGIDIIKHLRKRTDEATEKYGWNFSTFATPAESTAGKFLRLDKKKFGVIEGVTDRDYYTNSFHIPVHFKITAFDKMRLEGPFHELCNAGAITYVELDGDAAKATKVVQKLVDYSRKCGISYFSINTVHDVCPICGYDGIINTDVCPSCGWKEGTEVEYKV